MDNQPPPSRRATRGGHDLDYRFRPYDPWTSYGQSKTVNILLAAVERWADDGITANALMPGNIADTSLARHVDMQQVADFVALGAIALPPQKTVEQGAATSVRPPRRRWRASAVAPSRTAWRPGRSPSGPVPSAGSRRTPWTGTTRPGCGPCPRRSRDDGAQSARYMMWRPTSPCFGWSKASGTVPMTVKPREVHRATAGLVSTTALKTMDR